MKKRFKKLDAVAAALLVGIVGTMAIAQVEGGPPTPAHHWCEGGSVTIGAQSVRYTGDYCPFNTDCGIEIIYNSVTVTFTARIKCLPRAS